MDYEKKYKEALEWARKVMQGKVGFVLDEVLEKFPELAESEDEQHRKWILEYLYDGLRKSDEQFKGQFKCAIAWLKTQGEQKPIIEMKSAEESLGIDSDTYNKIVDECIYGEQKPADKVEPKFREGDWVVQGCNILKIRCVGDEYYCFETVGGYVNDMLISEIDSLYHLWSIQDAKDGDVLAESSCIFIIQKLDDNNTAETYCTLYNDGDFDDGTILYFDIDSTKPATKEQRNQLEKAMADAGYTFDFEKKELKKIKQKPAETEKGAKGNDGENPNSAWGEEDELFFNELIEFFEGDILYVRWLKTLKERVQPKQEWSEEDERAIGIIKVALEHPYDMEGKLDRKFALDWLRELKSRIKLIE